MSNDNRYPSWLSANLIRILENRQTSSGNQDTCFWLDAHLSIRGRELEHQERKGKYALCPYSVCIWQTNPELENDDCSTGRDYATREEAEAVYQAADPAVAMGCRPGYFTSEEWVEIDGPGINMARQFRTVKRKRQDSDDEWRREMAMEAGMAFGCQGYNEVMGYD